MNFGIIKKFGPRLDFAGLPLFKELAPHIKVEFPDIWWRMLQLLDDECRAEAEKLAEGKPADIAALAIIPKKESAHVAA